MLRQVSRLCIDQFETSTSLHRGNLTLENQLFKFQPPGPKLCSNALLKAFFFKKGKRIGVEFEPEMSSLSRRLRSKGPHGREF